ncbi:MAG: DoxX family protein, partial [Acidimicrobiia bacterium]
MNIALWVAQGVLAGIFLLAGYTKVTREHGELAERMEWVEDFTVLSSNSWVGPRSWARSVVLTPTAAVALAVEQVGA